MNEFLTILSEFYYLVIYSASDERIVKHLMKYIDSQGVFFKDILSKNECVTLKNGVNL